MKKKRRPTVIDLFAGAGIFSNAFIKEHFEVIRAVELDSKAAATYALNLGNHIDIADIQTVKPHGRCDVLIAGPPCQGFSTLGKRNPNDYRNSLSLEVLKWAKITKPQIIVIENVAAFLKSPVWPKLVQGLEKLKYEVNAEILNACDYGVPQKRRRSFTIASKIGMPDIKSIKKRPIKTVRDAWKGLPPKPNNINLHYSPNPSDLALDRMKLIPKGGDKRDIMRLAPNLCAPSWKKLGNQVVDVWGRMKWDEPCNTLRTSLQNASKGRYIHPSQNRVITLREAARLHTIDDTWTFIGTPTSIAKQIGNSVPTNLGRAVARGIMKLM